MVQGSLFSWGANSYGQLGQGHVSEQVATPAVVHLNPQIGKIVCLRGGGGHSVLLDDTGTLWSAGWNSRGQLGPAKTGKLIIRFIYLYFSVKIRFGSP